MAPRPVLALNEVVNRLDYGLAGVEANLLEDGHQRLTELVEGLLRLPDVEYLELVAGAEARVIQTPGGFARTSCVQTPDDIVVLCSGHGYGVEVDADRHEFLPKLADSCGGDAWPSPGRLSRCLDCSRVCHRSGRGTRPGRPGEHYSGWAVLTGGPDTSASSSARHTSVMSTMPTRPASPTTGKCLKRPLVMTLAASRMLVVVLTTVGRAVIC